MKLAVFNEHINDAVKQTGRPRLDILKELKANGITSIEYGIQDLTDLTKVKEELAAVGMDICSIYEHKHYENNGPTDFHIVDVAAALGVKQLLLIPGFFREGVADEVVLAQCVRAMNEIGAKARELGMAISIEPLDATDSVMPDLASLLWFGEQVSDLDYTFDAGNFIYVGEDELTAFEQLKDRIIHVHLKDRSQTPIAGAAPTTMATGQVLYSVAVGQGIIKMAEVVAGLKAINYQGYLTIEHFNAGDYLTTMLESAKWIQAQLA